MGKLRRMTLEKFQSIWGSLGTATRNHLVAQLNETEQGIELTQPVPVVLVGATGSGAEPLVGSSATRGPTVTAEGSSLTNIEAYELNSQFGIYAMAAQPSFTGLSVNTGQVTNKTKRLMQTTYTATAGGEVAIADLVPALAGYRSCLHLWGMYSNQTDVSVVFTIATTTGLTTGPGTWDIATTANQVTDYNQGIYWYGSTDNEAITWLCAAGQAGNAQTFQPIGVYWYET